MASCLQPSDMEMDREDPTEEEEGDNLISLDDLGDWQSRFGFVNDADRLFKQYKPTEKPRIPAEDDKNMLWREHLLPQTVSCRVYGGNIY